MCFLVVIEQSRHHLKDSNGGCFQRFASTKSTNTTAKERAKPHGAFVERKVSVAANFRLDVFLDRTCLQNMLCVNRYWECAKTNI